MKGGNLSKNILFFSHPGCDFVIGEKMKILVLNQGSSSLKCSIFDFSAYPNEHIEPVWETKIEWKNVQESRARKLRSQLKGKSIDCIGHRIVHGGSRYKKSVLIDRQVKKEIRRFSDLAPLHNLADLEGIEILESLFPGKPQIAVFDTAFHHTLPLSAAIYPGPYKWAQMQIQRYGFHGISYQYCSQKAAQMLGKMPERMVICHLGSGASLCAIKKGKSIDTTMGFTPLEGLMMDTRSGTVDPGILLYLLKKKNLEALTRELYEKSGLLGLSGISSDMRDILEKAEQGHMRANLALNVYVHRLISLIGSMVTSLGGLDVLVFTAGIGENAPSIRKQVTDRLAFLGHFKVLVIQTQEAFEIARECWRKIIPK